LRAQVLKVQSISPNVARTRTGPKVRTAMLALALGIVAALSGCAQRPVNAPLAHIDASAGYRFAAREAGSIDRRLLVVLAFSGGGTRAAAFSYGVLEALRDVEIEGPGGRRVRLLDDVAVVSGVSGGSFTALAWGLYGDRLFAEYEARFLKRNVEGAMLERLANPVNWARLASPEWGRSELAAEYYDEILFEGATFGDLARKRGAMIVPTATDIATGARVPFNQVFFDLICSDLASFPLSRAAAASSAVPAVLSPVTLVNRGGKCGTHVPPWLADLMAKPAAGRPAERALGHVRQLQRFADSDDRPFLHLVDGGLSDNLGVRGAIEVLETLEALHLAGRPTPFDDVRRIVVFVVNSQSDRHRDWSRRSTPPGPIDVVLQASAVPIHDYSSEAVELLKNMQARWSLMRELRHSPSFAPDRDPALAARLATPSIDLHAIDVSFGALADARERAYLNELPTSLALPPEAVDRLRGAARTLVHESAELKRALGDAGARIVPAPAAP